MESVIGMINEFDTIAAIATAVSNAGIGIIRISGSEAMEILAKIFEHIIKKWMFISWKITVFIMVILKTARKLWMNVSCLL